jgi:hypothetical protein
MTKETPMTKSQETLVNFHQVLECGGRAIAATPLSYAPNASELSGISLHSKDTKAFRTLQDSGARIACAGIGNGFRQGIGPAGGLERLVTVCNGL